MKRPPSSIALLFSIVAASKVAMGITHLTQRDGDLAAHIAVGNHIIADRAIPQHSLSSYTAAGEPFVAHAWLSELLFSFLYKLGGLVLVGVVAAIIIAATHALILDFLRRRDLDPRWALTAALVSLAVASSHWLARPHMFSILGAALTLVLLESHARRKLLLGAALFLLWANLHGGWAFGLVLIASYAIGELLEWKLHGDVDARARLASHLKLLLVGSAVTLINPYGPRLHIEILDAATNPLLATSISEYLSPNFQTLAALPFLLSLLATIGILAMSRQRMPWPWTVTLLVTLFFALRGVRAIPMFAVASWPLIAVHAARSFGHAWNVRLFGEFARLDRTGITRPWILVTVGLLLAFGLNRGSVLGNTIVSDRFDRSIFPLAAAGNARAAGIGQRVFAPWAWGGFFTLAWPEAKHHVDPLKFNRTTVESYARIEGVLPGWRDALDEWRVDAVVEPPDSPLATALADEPGWQRWYHDPTAALFVRRETTGETDP